MNMELLERAIRINGVTHVVFNKVDVLRTVGVWAVIDNNKVKKFKGEKEMKAFILKRLTSLGVKKSNIFFSESKERI